MRRHLKLILLILYIATQLFAQIKVYDDLGREIELDSPAQRIVSLAPSITETLFFLGVGDRVVGVTRYCNFPPEAKSKTIVGGVIDPNYEVIVSLCPHSVNSLKTPLAVSGFLRVLRIQDSNFGITS